ncbi:protein-methionine-sulfoxide reductase heme-binding subunit MsrQ [Pseudoruegeria sp. SK021]|uniref:protein-methionine-sulfoxide reductase heme-binding subunit MsrQ n=1 Tax=Pseudoruegeria sp. SK021 TaxID=1933035 RepID=UPI000A22BACC|nr:sulfoxide reductase heme-binding subunit YedZ [Pseudoruegeria sp. SK021]
MTDTVNSAARRLPTGVVYGVGLVPMGWLFWLAVSGQLGVDPTKALEHRYGLIGLQFLIASLCVTPLRRFAGLNLLRFRRALGLLTFFYIAAHLSVWLVLDVQQPALIWQDILNRPYITIGMVGFLCLLPLALTSNAWSIRRLGAMNWRRLHRLAYLAAMLGAIHYVMLVKGWQVTPLLYLTGIVGLVGLRLVPRGGFGFVGRRGNV